MAELKISWIKPLLLSPNSFSSSPLLVSRQLRTLQGYICYWLIIWILTIDWSVLFHWQILAEFERIVGFSASSTGVLDSFKHNFGQVVEGILKLARTSMVGQKNKVPIEEFLELLESDVEDNQELDSSSGKWSSTLMYAFYCLVLNRYNW